MKTEEIFTLDISNIKFGQGVTYETGFEMQRLSCKNVMVVTDPNMSNSEATEIALNSLQSAGIRTTLYDKVHIEPTDVSFKEAIAFANNMGFDGYLAIGGGSSIDTAKAVNLYQSYPAEFLTYVNAPVGLGAPVPGPLKPLIAIPTTSGTGSETTGVSVFDLLEMKAKTGIASRYLKPNVGLLDPNNVRTLPPMITACSGMDTLGHALESFTALPFHNRVAPESPETRPAYQGANPLSDIWAKSALSTISRNLVRAVQNNDDLEARGQMLLTSAIAGFGFGNAGCHLPHGMSYPVSGMVKDYVAPDYPPNTPLIPHGMAVALNSPAVYRFTGPTNPNRHLEAVSLLGGNIENANPEEAGDLLAEEIIKIMRKIGMPNGLSAVGYNTSDVDDLIAGTMPQHRVIKLSPREVDEKGFEQLFMDSMKLW